MWFPFASLQLNFTIMPTAQISLTLRWCVVTFHNLTLIAGTGKLITTAQSRNITLVSLSISQTLSFWECCRPGPRILNNWCGRKHFEEWYIWYSYICLMQVIFWDQKKRMTGGKMIHMGTMDRGFAVPLFVGPYMDVSVYYINHNKRCG